MLSYPPSKALLTFDKVSDFVHGLDHTEGLAWGLDGFVYAGGESGQLYRIDPNSPEARLVTNTGGFLLGLALDADSNVYACDAKHAVVQKITQSGRVTTYSHGAPGEPFILPNYPTFDALGNLYIADSGKWKSDNGKIFKIHPGGRTEVWCRTLCEFPNGLCLNAAGTHLYVAVSLNPPRVSRVEILADGSAGEVESVVEMPRTVPDGLAFDTRGVLYIACYRPDAIYYHTPEREYGLLVEDYEGTAIAAPTNIAFCGDKLDILLSANIGRWHLTRYNIDARGLRLCYPKLPGA